MTLEKKAGGALNFGRQLSGLARPSVFPEFLDKYLLGMD